MKFILWLTFSLSLWVGLSESFAQVGVTLNAPQGVSVGEVFDVSVNVSNVVALDTASFSLRFNEKVVQFLNMQVGTLMEPASLTYNRSGEEIRLVINHEGIDGVTGQGPIVFCQFLALNQPAKFSDFTISNLLMGTNLAAAIPAQAGSPLRVTVVGTPPQTVQMSVDAPSQAAFGAIIDLFIETTSVNNLDTVGFTLLYPPAVLQYLSVEVGAALPIGTSLTLNVAPGSVRGVMNLPGVDGFDGEGAIVHVRFQVVGHVASQGLFAISNLILGDTFAQPIESKTGPPIPFVVSGTPMNPVKMGMLVPQTVRAGDSFTAYVGVAPVEVFDVASFSVAYDETVLRVNRVVPGSLTADAQPLANVVAGQVNIVVNKPKVSGISGTGTLAGIEFEAIGVSGSQSTLDLFNVLMGDTNGLPVPTETLDPALVHLNANAPSSVKVSPKTTTSVDEPGFLKTEVIVTQVNQLDTASFVLVYDPGALQVTQVSAVDLFAGASLIENLGIPGQVHVVVNLNDVAGASGKGAIVSVQFQEIGGPVGNGSITLAGVLLGDNFANQIPLTTKVGFSSVAFLPGFPGSRLYRIQQFENQLWEPNWRADLSKLSFDATTFQSTNSDIYTRDIIDEKLHIGGNIYKTFIDSMNQMVNDEKIIKEWKALPYDWRVALEDIVNGGLDIGLDRISYLLPTVTPYIINQLEQLAQGSASGKVTIVAHSNGGLLAKVLIDEMKAQGKSDLIDRLIMVATPQLGTPKALLPLLHGDLDFLGYLLGRHNVREFLENLRPAYNLLPSERYLNVVLDPVIAFDPSVDNLYNFRSFYGNFILSGEFDELISFLTGGYGATGEPVPNDILSPNVLEPILLALAENTHTKIDTWVPPDNIDVIQIAGWGLDTIRGIEYLEKEVTIGNIPVSTLGYKPLFTTDGDETVVIPSAIAMDGMQRVMTYYVNLDEYNDVTFFNRQHDSIMEVKPVIDLIKKIIQHDTSSLPPHIYPDMPQDKNPRLRMRMASPVAVDVYDRLGNHTGFIENPTLDSDVVLFEEKIPNSYYWSIAEDIYIGVDTRNEYHIELTGLASGTFTWEIQEVLGNEKIDKIVYKDIPVSPSMKGEMVIQAIESASQLKIDEDGDGIIDLMLNPTIGPIEDVTDRIQFDIFNARFNRRTGQYSVMATLTNLGDDSLFELQMVIGDITSPNVTVANADGTTPATGKLPNERPYYNFVDLAPGETSEAKQFIFNNPNRVRFQFGWSCWGHSGK